MRRQRSARNTNSNEELRSLIKDDALPHPPIRQDHSFRIGRSRRNFHVASLSGSSYFKLPPVLQWFSGNIGLHHVHHLCSRVPNYQLQTCVEAAPELDRVTKVITLRESIGCWRLALWDEQRRALRGFRDLKSDFPAS
jgi:fatty acid desaturase